VGAGRDLEAAGGGWAANSSERRGHGVVVLNLNLSRVFCSLPLGRQAEDPFLVRKHLAKKKVGFPRSGGPGNELRGWGGGQRRCTPARVWPAAREPSSVVEEADVIGANHTQLAGDFVVFVT